MVLAPGAHIVHDRPRLGSGEGLSACLAVARQAVTGERDELALPHVDPSPTAAEDGPMSLDEYTRRIIESMPKRPISPMLIFGFEDIADVIRLVESAITSHSAETEAQANEMVTQSAQGAFEGDFLSRGIFRSIAASYARSESIFPMILRRSVLIAIASHVEHVLRQWCPMLQTRLSLGRTLDDFQKHNHEADVHWCMRYLHEEAHLAVAGFETWPEWLDLDAYRHARNALAHNGGIVNNHQRQKLQRLALIHIDESHLHMNEPNVHVRPGACEHAAETARTFFQRLSGIAEADPRLGRPMQSGG
jgi:hypothetical protein